MGDNQKGQISGLQRSARAFDLIRRVPDAYQRSLVSRRSNAAGTDAACRTMGRSGPAIPPDHGRKLLAGEQFLYVLHAFVESAISEPD